jgi:NitT/TauT family transport system substrate-binding protein
MSTSTSDDWGRRDFLKRSTLAGAAGLLGLTPQQVAAEPPPETTRIRLSVLPSVCLAPQYVAEALLRAEGFSEVQYVPVPRGSTGGVPGAMRLGAGEIDVDANFAAPLVVAVDRGAPIVILGGVHVGCFDLVASGAVRTITDLKGKTVAVFGMESAQHTFLASMLAYVGLDPNKDVTWLVRPSDEAKRLLADGKVDGFLGFPPDPQELRAKKIGHVVVTSAADRPWSQYFCCMLSANRDFVARYPVAAKRTLRAILKAVQVCAVDAPRAARAYLDRGFNVQEEYVLQALRELPWTRWRELSPEDTLRFYALRLHEAGMIKSNPQKIIAQGTDWRFLNELKKELKG